MPQAKNKNAPGLEIILHPTPDPSSPTPPEPPTSPTYNPIYRPGSLITGTVTLTSTSDIPIGSVSICFYGRAKVKIVQNNGQSNSEYRSRANFFNIEQTLFEGGYTFKAGTREWPFSIICPIQVDVDCLGGGLDKKGKAKIKFKPRDGFLSTEHGNPLDDMAKEAGHLTAIDLPPAMQYYHGLFIRQAGAYIEYVLTATVAEPEDGSGTAAGIFGKARRTKKRTSTRIINFIPLQESINTDWALTTDTFNPVIKTSKLTNAAFVDAGSAKESTSGSVSDRVDTDDFFSGFSKTTTSPTGLHRVDSPSSMIDDSSPSNTKPPRRSSSLFSRLSFSRSSTPRLTLNVTVTYPTTIQVASPSTIPFRLNIAPDLSPTATNLNPSCLPKILIKTFSFTVLCCTKVRAHSIGSGERDTKTVSIKLCENFPVNKTIDLSSVSSLAPFRANTAAAAAASSSDPKTQSTYPDEKKSPLPTGTTMTTTNASDSPSSELGAINLGVLADLRLRSAKLGHILEPLVVPSFSTYNIQRIFGLKYSIEMEIVGTGKTECIKGEVKRGELRVLGAPDCEIEGEDGGARLPGYAEVVDVVDLEALGGRVDDDDDDVDGGDDDEGGGGGEQEGGEGKRCEKGKGKGRGQKEVLAEMERERAREGAQIEADQEVLPEYSRYDRQA